MEIIDAQIHEPEPGKPIDPQLGAEVKRLVSVECAREAMDSVGVDVALVFAAQDFTKACVERYPDRFAGALRFDFNAPDLEEQIATFRSKPGMLAGRCLLGDGPTEGVRPEFPEGRLEPVFTFAEKYEVPLFIATTGWTHLVEEIAQQHPGLTIIIDHFGLSQSPPSPRRADPWDRLPRLLALGKYPNVNVKCSGAPVLSSEPYPFQDAWPYLHQVISAFGPERLMWGSDFTRLRWIPGVHENAPRSQWKIYSDSLNFLRDTTEISEQDKRMMFGETIRRVLRWT